MGYTFNYNSKEFGNRIRVLRKKNHITQEELAERLMVSVDSVSNYENGRTTCMHDHIMHMCEIFNVTADYFYFGKVYYEQCNSKIVNEITELVLRSNDYDKTRINQMIKLLLDI